MLLLLLMLLLLILLLLLLMLLLLLLLLLILLIFLILLLMRMLGVVSAYPGEDICHPLVCRGKKPPCWILAAMFVVVVSCRTSKFGKQKCVGIYLGLCLDRHRD